MLTEFHGVKQEPDHRRRWFECDGLELIVWYDGGDRLAGFQLCYFLPDGERALSWRAATGFVHSRVDNGDSSPFRNETPVLQPGGPVPWELVTALFADRAGTIEPDLRECIAAQLAARR